MTRRKLTMIALLALVGGVLAYAAPVFAAVQGTCNVSDTSKVLLYENAIGDTLDNNDSLWKCTGDIDLGNDTHTLPGNCNAGLLASGVWNDCVSSFRPYIPSDQKLCLYTGASYGGDVIGAWLSAATGTRIDVPAPYKDTLSSFKFISSGTGC